MEYPGDTADPKDVAAWMSWVAEKEFSLPGILPVMCSCVELTSAWTGPGNVTDIDGYLWPSEGEAAAGNCSVGYFQQQADDLGCGYFGWGLRAQCIDADYALRRFCEAAKHIEDDSPADTPEQLGAWCQAVQNSAYPDRYADIGYPMAKELLGNGDTVTEKAIWQTHGWYTWESPTSWNLIFQPPEKPATPFKWPVANDAPIPNSASYVERCPTRYSWREGGRSDVEQIALRLINNYSVSCNTYYRHPESVWLEQGVSREYDSVDVWGPGGRGDPIDKSVGDEIFSLLFNDPNPPDIEWVIWQATMYGAWNGWQGEAFGSDDFTWHMDHIHLSYV